MGKKIKKLKKYFIFKKKGKISWAKNVCNSTQFKRFLKKTLFLCQEAKTHRKFRTKERIQL